MLVEDLRTDNGETVITGVVRGRSLKADRLVQVGEWGDFQIAKITAAPLFRNTGKAAADAMAVDASSENDVLEEPSEHQDGFAELAPEEATMQDTMAMSLAPSERRAVLLDDHHYFDDDEPSESNLPKRLPKGTSKYQAAWYLGDMSDDGSDMEDVDDDDEQVEPDANSTALGPADGHFDNVMRNRRSTAVLPSTHRAKHSWTLRRRRRQISLLHTESNGEKKQRRTSNSRTKLSFIPVSSQESDCKDIAA